jgi:hypothetical protein
MSDDFLVFTLWPFYPLLIDTAIVWLITKFLFATVGFDLVILDLCIIRKLFNQNPKRQNQTLYNAQQVKSFSARF